MLVGKAANAKRVILAFFAGRQKPDPALVPAFRKRLIQTINLNISKDFTKGYMYFCKQVYPVG